MSCHKFSVVLFVLVTFVGVCRAAALPVSPSSQTSGSSKVMASPESVVVELYAALSFASGNSINRDRVRLLFAADAQILFGGRRPNGSAGERRFTVESFLDFATPSGEGASREERELWRRVERFGNIAHVFSAYQLSFTGTSGNATVRRGINSVQLYFDGARWRIVSLIWDVESPGNPLPSQTTRANRSNEQNAK